MPSTPSQFQPQLWGWNHYEPGPSKTVIEASPLPRFGMHAKGSPHKNLSRNPPISENVKPSILPGFHNSFMPPSPDRVPRKRLDKGKAKEVDQYRQSHDLVFPRFESQFADSFHRRRSPPSSPAFAGQMAESDLGIQDFMHVGDGDQTGGKNNIDTDMDMFCEDADQQDSENILFYDWKAEVSISSNYLNLSVLICPQLHGIILTHCHPSSDVSTFQMLMSAPQSSKVPADLFHSACGKILENMSFASSGCEVVISYSLVQIAQMLRGARSVSSVIV
jgi:hypothetical protein